MSDNRKEVEEDLESSLLIAETVLHKRYPGITDWWPTDKVRLFIEVGLEIFKELRKKEVRK